MTPVIVSIVVLVAIFVIATVLPINLGALGFVAAAGVGVLVVGMSLDDVLAEFPGDLFLILLGLTYLFAVAHQNGTVDLLVRWSMRLVRGHLVGRAVDLLHAVRGVLGDRRAVRGRDRRAAGDALRPPLRGGPAAHGHDGRPRLAGGRLLPDQRLRHLRGRRRRPDGDPVQPHRALPRPARDQPGDRRGPLRRPRRPVPGRRAGGAQRAGGRARGHVGRGRTGGGHRGGRAGRTPSSRRPRPSTAPRCSR